MRLFSGILLLLALSFPLLGEAVSRYVPTIADPVMEPWRWREVDDLDGQGVLCVDEAADGALWFGCIGGLVRYDGMTVERVPFDEELMAREGSAQSRAPWGRSVLCMEDGSILVLIDSGLAQWANGRWKVIFHHVGPASFEAKLERAEDGSVWLMTSAALRRFSADLTHEDLVLYVSGSQRLIAFCQDESGDVWVVRNTRGDVSDLIHIPLQDGRPISAPMWGCYRVGGDAAWLEASLCAGPEGRIWYVDNQLPGRVLAFDPAATTWTAMKNPDTPRMLYSLIKDATGTLWAGGTGSLHTIGQAGEHNYPLSVYGIPSVPLKLFQSSTGVLWVLGREGYVYTLDTGTYRWLTYLGLHYECETQAGMQWYLKGARDVVSVDPSVGEWLRYRTEDGLIDHPESLHVSSHGLVWAIGHHDGAAAISVFDGQRWERRVHPEFAVQIGAGSLFEAEDGTVWLGAIGDRQFRADAGGMLQYTVTATGEVQLLSHFAPPEVPYHVSRIVGTSDGSFLLGSSKLCQYDPGSKTLRSISDLPSVYTHALVMDQNQDVWVAKGLFGVYRKDGDGWRHYAIKDGLPGKFVVDLLPLADGTLLAALDKGISRFDGRSWAGAVLSDDFGMSNRAGSLRQSADGSIWYNFNVRDARSPRVLMSFGSETRYCTVRHRAEARPPDTWIEPHPEEVGESGNLHVSWTGRDPWGDTPAGQLQYSWCINEGEWSHFSSDAGRTFFNLKPGRHVLAVRARDRDFNVDPSPAISQFTVIPPVWTRSWFVALVLSLAGVSSAFVGMMFYQHEKRLKERQRHMVEMEQLKTGFFTNISHELNTPLGLIKGALEHMLDNEEEKEKLHEIAMRSVDRVSTLVSQILDFRKLEQGRIQMELVEGDLSAYLRKYIEVLLPLANKKQVTCEVEIAPACAGWLDPDKLEKIVSNLVVNAIKYTPSGGRVRVMSTERAGPDGGRVITFVVEDSGAGVKPEHMQHIFDRFYRIPEKSVVDGSGIGLNLTKELVDLWGGDIRVESPIYSDPEHPGSRFSVTLPIEREQIPNCGASYEEL